MKQFLILLSSITTLTISSTTFANINQNTTVTDNLQTNNNNNNQTALFNNKYRYLSDSDIITNQSIIDNKYYSYDTSALKNYSFANARNTFLVNKTGNLVYNPEITIPDKDKVDIANTKQEMISHKKVTNINENNEIKSDSEFSDNYFNGYGKTWKYLQFSQLNSNINISSQQGADKVEYHDNLSEALGIYYIAKAEINNKIDKSIAQQLSKYFINQSSLQTQISNLLTTKILDLIINNQEIYNFILNTPFHITNVDKGDTLNYVFDDTNNLVEIYYTIQDNFKNAFNFKYNKSLHDNDFLNRDMYFMFDTTKYAKNWKDFTLIFPKITFNAKSSVGINNDWFNITQELKGSTLDINTSDIPFDRGVLEHKWHFEFDKTGAFWIHQAFFGVSIYFIYENDNKLYLYLDASSGSWDGGTNKIWIDINASFQL